MNEEVTRDWYYEPGYVQKQCGVVLCKNNGHPLVCKNGTCRNVPTHVQIISEPGSAFESQFL